MTPCSFQFSKCKVKDGLVIFVIRSERKEPSPRSSLEWLWGIFQYYMYFASPPFLRLDVTHTQEKPSINPK